MPLIQVYFGGCKATKVYVLVGKMVFRGEEEDQYVAVAISRCYSISPLYYMYSPLYCTIFYPSYSALASQYTVLGESKYGDQNIPSVLSSTVSINSKIPKSP
jgi:hypothetical protein